MAGRFKHFEIKTGTLFQPLGFEQFVLAFQFVQALAEFFLNMRNRLRQSRPRRDVVVGRIDGHFFQIGGFLPVSESNSLILSISSPKKEMRQARSS